MTVLARILATWFGAGLSPVWPGTVGTLAALPVYFVARTAGTLGVLAAAVALTGVGVWSAGVVARASRAHDPQFIVIDEVCGVLFALAAAPPTLLGVSAAVLLFRLFDVTKPFPARAAERLPGGWGIVMDDVLAGGWAALVLVVLRALGGLA